MLIMTDFELAQELIKKLNIESADYAVAHDSNDVERCNILEKRADAFVELVELLGYEVDQCGDGSLAIEQV